MVTKKGQMYLNGVPMSAERLETDLGELLKGAKDDEARAVTIKADKACEYQSVVSAIDVVNRLDGILVLIMEEEGTPAQSGPVTVSP